MKQAYHNTTAACDADTISLHQGSRSSLPGSCRGSSFSDSGESDDAEKGGCEGYLATSDRAAVAADHPKQIRNGWGHTQ